MKYFLLFTAKQIDRLRQVVSIFSDQIGRNDGRTSANSMIAMNKNIPFLPILVYKVKSYSKVLPYLLFLCIVHGQMQIVDTLFQMT